MDAGFAWTHEGVLLSGVAFFDHIDDYIERVEVAPDVLSFRNVTSGAIWGFEAEGAVPLAWGVDLFAQGHWMRGRSDDGDDLADIPVPRVSVGLRRTLGRIHGELRYQHRFDKTDPGSGEPDRE